MIIKEYCLKSLLFSVQNALDMNISSNLRAVTVGIKDVIVDVIFYYDGEISDDEFDMMSMTELDLFTSGYKSFYDVKKIERIKLKNKNSEECTKFYYIKNVIGKRYDYPQNINNKKLNYWVYMRKENLRFYDFDYKFSFDKNSFLDMRLLLIKSFLGLIIPSIRFILFEYDMSSSLIIRIINDGEITRELYSIKSELKKRISKKLLDNDVHIDINIDIIRHDFPKFLFELEFENETLENRGAIYTRAKECMGCWD